MPIWFQRFLMPGLVFESIVVGGGYATGRELSEFFLKHGPLGGLLGLLATMVVWGIVLALTFEFARQTRSLDYRSFFRHLIGRGWVIFEAAYLLTLVLVLSVIGAAAGSLGHDAWGLPSVVGTLALMALIALLVAFGSSLVERALSFWGVLLYVVYGSLVWWCLTRHGSTVLARLNEGPSGSGWIMGGVAYAGYNLAAAPMVLFALRHQTSRAQALTSGLIGGAIGILPALLLYLSLLAFYPASATEAVPTVYVIAQLHQPWFEALFQVTLFGTFVKTGVGLLHALNERLAQQRAERNRGPMPGWSRAAVSTLALFVALVLASRFGIVDLIARGYGTLTYVFLAVFVVPILTVGAWRVRRSQA